MRSRHFVVAFLIGILPASVTLQSPQRSTPRTPSEAYARATEPVREFFKSPNPTLEASLRANKEQERLAAQYYSLFKAQEWKGEELEKRFHLRRGSGRKTQGVRETT